MYKTLILIVVSTFISAGAQKPLGYVQESNCFSGDSITGGVSIPLKGKFLNVELFRNNVSLLLHQDYKYFPDSLILLADSLKPGDTLCVNYFKSPIIPNSLIFHTKESQIPVLKKNRKLIRKQIHLTDTNQTPEYDLYYGGSKSLMVTVGEEGGLGLEQSLQLDVNGQLSENVYVQGHLSDQDIPIQPEGNTATLREVDQIYIKIYGRQYSYLLGDYTLDFGQDGLDKHISKVQGMYGKYQYDQITSEAGFSKSRGNYHSYIFSGEFGKQSNYFLRSPQGAQFITVLAGSEKIWRNGEKLERGKHYQIEYGEGRIDFLNTLVVTGDDQFTVEFEFTQKDYPSFLVSANVSDTMGNWKWSLRGITNRDSKDNPQGFVLTDEDIEEIKKMGSMDERPRTLGRGVPIQDSTWREGLYVYDSTSRFYHYVDSLSFDSILGAGEVILPVQFTIDDWGGYQRVSDFEFIPAVGGAGPRYSPGLAVTLPESKTHYVLQTGVRFGGDNNLPHQSDFSFYLSDYDENIFGPKEDQDNVGFGAQYKGAQSLGKPLDKGGVSELTLKGNALYRNRNYTFFRQQVEPPRI